MTRKTFLLPFFLLLLCLPLAVFSTNPIPLSIDKTLVISSKQNSFKGTLNVTCAHTTSEHKKGMMFHKSLPHNHGMLFIFDSPSKRSFWMKNTYVTLDIFWIDKNKTVVQIDRNVPPETSEKVPERLSSVPILYVLEVSSQSPITQVICLQDKLSW